MCGDVGNTNMYDYISPFKDTQLIICKKCAIREYYGTRATQSKRYRKDKETNNLFRNKVSGN